MMLPRLPSSADTVPVKTFTVVLLLHVAAIISSLSLSPSSPSSVHAFKIVSPPPHSPFTKHHDLTITAAAAATTTRIKYHGNWQRNKIVLNSNPNESNDTNEISKEYLDKASILRKEIEEMESQMTTMRSTMGGRETNDGGAQADKNTSTRAIYTTLDNSMWTISYRFASDPIPQGNENENNDNGVAATTTSTVNAFYSGKITILLKDDGYTELLINNDNSNNDKSSISFQKMWGWDEEVSREDDKTYLSFSADVILPETDVNYDPSKPDAPSRFYFNAQVEKNSKTGEISLTNGTVTVKRDVASPAGGGRFWGLFNAGGILAQFRYCGEFLMKPTSQN